MRYKVDNNVDIFKYLNPKSDDKLLNMKDRDLVNIMLVLKQYYLELRNTLNISQDITFAGEIEFEEANRDEIELKLYSTFPDDDWIVKDDCSLSNGGEINSPVLRDNEKTWIDLGTVCDIVSNNAYVLDNTSAHVHIGMQILGDNPKYWRNFVKLWMTYENIIYRFLYGEYTSPRSRIKEFAMPISKDLINVFDRIEDRAKMKSSYYILKVLYCDENRKNGVNFKNAAESALYNYNKVANKNTIEFRSPNGTFDEVIWQNNINVLVKLLQYAKSDKFNDEILNRRLREVIVKGIPSNLCKYSQIYIEQAIEFADLVFDNNLDKIYFLRQYIKSGEVSTKSLVRSRSFTL